MLSSRSVVSLRLRYTTWGHVVSKDGMVVDPENVISIMEWETPNNVYEVIYFMGLEGYYKRFIRNFSQITYLITSL